MADFSTRNQCTGSIHLAAKRSHLPYTKAQASTRLFENMKVLLIHA